MDFFWVFLIVMFCFSILGFMLWSMARYNDDNIKVTVPDNSKRGRSSPPADYEMILTRSFPFYNTLDLRLRKKFRKRLERFIRLHTFEGREGFTVTDEAKVLISAAAIRLTLGLGYYDFEEYPQILIYPNVYYSPFTKTLNKGETNPHGIMAFSWPHIVEGFKTTADHINLAYHEFTHALITVAVSDIRTDGCLELGYDLLSYAFIQEHFSQKINSLKIFRDYAFTNKMEFLAVAVENFLESPEELRQHSSEMYNILKHMLRQDPIGNQYGLNYSYGDDYYWSGILSSINQERV
jgi:MtfA peptidase